MTGGTRKWASVIIISRTSGTDSPTPAGVIARLTWPCRHAFNKDGCQASVVSPVARMSSRPRVPDQGHPNNATYPSSRSPGQVRAPRTHRHRSLTSERNISVALPDPGSCLCGKGTQLNRPRELNRSRKMLFAAPTMHKSSDEVEHKSAYLVAHPPSRSALAPCPLAAG